MAVISALTLSGCNNPPDTPRTRAGRCQVGLVGDSLTVGLVTYGGIKQKLYDNVCSITAVDGKVSRLTSAGADVVEAWANAGTLPSVLVVELGTNDCTAAVFERHARRILAAAGPDRPVVWINTWSPGCDPAVNGVIAKLRNQGSSRADGGRLWILDHRTWIGANRKYLAGDGLHLTAAGYGLYAQRLIEILGIRRR